MKKLLGILCITLSSAMGGTITVNSNNGLSIRDSEGALISGGAIRVGTLKLESPGDFIVENTNEFQKIDSLWTPLAEGTTDGGTVMQSGNTGQTLIVNDQFSLGDFFGQITNPSSLPAGTKLYLWFFNHAIPSEATEWAIVSSSSSSWTAPSSLTATTLTTGSVDQIFRGTLSEDEIKLEPKNSPSGFNAWAVTHFNSSQLAGNEANENANPDGDDWTNLAEYAFDMDPHTPDSPGERFKIAVSSDGESVLRFQSVDGREDLKIVASTSTDLLNWSPSTAHEIAPNTFETLLAPSGKGFARLQFTRTP